MYKELKLFYIFSKSMGTIFSILFGGYLYGYKKRNVIIIGNTVYILDKMRMEKRNIKENLVLKQKKLV